MCARGAPAKLHWCLKAPISQVSVTYLTGMWSFLTSMPILMLALGVTNTTASSFFKKNLEDTIYLIIPYIYIILKTKIHCCLIYSRISFEMEG